MEQHHFRFCVIDLLTQINTKLDNLAGLQNKEVKFMADATAALAALNAQVAQDGSLVSSAVTALNGLTKQVADLAAQLAAQGVPQAVVDQVQALADQMTANNAALAAAIPASTPAAPGV